MLKQTKFDTVIPVHVTLRVMAPLSTFRGGGGGFHLQMFAIRGVVQESLGCSPSELVFAHTVSGPLKLLREKWFCEGTEQSLLDNVSNFRAKLCRACEITSSSLEAAHVRMKGWFDRHNKSRECMPGDKVLMLAGLQACRLAIVAST